VLLCAQERGVGRLCREGASSLHASRFALSMRGSLSAGPIMHPPAHPMCVNPARVVSFAVMA